MGFDFFYTNFQKCDECNGIKLHGAGQGLDQHTTCTCNLISKNPAICCVKGLEDLLKMNTSIINRIQIIPKVTGLTQCLYQYFSTPLVDDDVEQECRKIIEKSKANASLL